ncbi:PHB depolymerase family esterase [Rhodoferax sp.]|uniref:extracellular catalytic domain type 1 short-chain-length polyhydroxyalkanoate depolymerase n=1 Tax=Rhodoferax sp. TaxID=50421 RepID=UPI0025F667C1|nr:PHB depolymerase family esterase [Rhodoferax sp.]
MNDNVQNLMREATQLTQAGQLNEATAAIQRALRGSSAGGGASASNWPLEMKGVGFEGDASAPAATGAFTSGTHTHGTLTRRFKLYTPPGQGGRLMPLVVMLHGCTQNPDDFAVGTGMNQRACEQGFCVLYPEQSQDANPSLCWNWFEHNHQQRGQGEPALIASMTQAVIKQHGIDPKRVFIAGLSAGGAMAAIVAAAYPEIFAAVGVHSGMPTGAASNMSEAFMVMRSGELSIVTRGGERGAGKATEVARRPQTTVPTIVFHGDQDTTVNPRNGEQVIAAVKGSGTSGPRVEQGVSASGRGYTRSTRLAGHGRVPTEHWLVHGAGHAWSGGSAKGSYTDGSGPDATLEMLRFFFEQRA